MPWSGASFSRTTGVFTGATAWQQTDAAAVGIEADEHDTHDQDLSDGINACLKKDGANLTADIPMGSKKLTGLAAGTANGHSVRFEEGGGASRASFSAHKNGTSQTVSATTETAVTFGTESFDVGAFFASNAWTPPAGTVLMAVTIPLTNADTGAFTIKIKKNSSTVLRSHTLPDASTASMTCSMTVIDQCNGTDAYTVTVTSSVDTDYTVSGGGDNVCVFSGTMI